MVKSVKEKIGVGLCTVAFACAIPTIGAFALNDTVSGGWSESAGYYSGSILSDEGGISPCSTPNHYGQAQIANFNGTDHKRSYGWTSWQGVYHYTRAQMVRWGSVVADSGRCWGWNETSAYSPWVAAQKDVGWPQAQTYYGN